MKRVLKNYKNNVLDAVKHDVQDGGWYTVSNTVSIAVINAVWSVVRDDVWIDVWREIFREIKNYKNKS